MVGDVIKIIAPDEFVRPIHAGNALATVQISEPIKILTIRTTAFAAAASDNSGAAVTAVNKVFSNDLSQFVGEELTVSARPELTSARVVISGGRGLKGEENFAMLKELADVLGGAVGATRAAVDAGWVPYSMQIGQTGKTVKPDLYIACGISGAVQHLSGMKTSKFIISINKDAEAPIFQYSDFGVVGDVFKVVPQLIEELKKRKSA